MWLYIRQLLQLILSPSRGWDDVSEAALTVDEVQRRGFYPWLAITALSEFIPVLYNTERTFLVALESAIAVAGGMFVAMYISRLVLDSMLGRFVAGGTVNITKAGVFALNMVGIACLFTVIENIMPASLTIVKSLPILSLVVIFRSSRFMGIDQSSVMSYVGFAALVTVILPMLTVGLIKFAIV